MLQIQYNRVYIEAVMKEKGQFQARTYTDRQVLLALDIPFNNHTLDKMYTLRKIQTKYQILQKPNLRNLSCEESLIN